MKDQVFILFFYSRIGADPLLQVLNKQMSLATAAAQTKNNPVAWEKMIINTLSFHDSISVVTGKDTGVFMDQWVRQGGHARFQMQFNYNRKRNTIEMQVNILLKLWIFP
jgi:transcription initiation factor TFIID subunit 2